MRTVRSAARVLALGFTGGATIALALIFTMLLDTESIAPRSTWESFVLVSTFTTALTVMHEVCRRGYDARVADSMQTSIKTSAQFYANHCVSTAFAVVISAVSIANLAALWNAPHSVLLGSRSPGGPDADLFMHVYPRVAAAGEFFGAYILYDLLFIARNASTMANAEVLCHHSVFLVAAWLLRSYYFAPGPATVFMTMEISTPFLNFCMLKDAFGWTTDDAPVRWGFILFAATFFLSRILLLAMSTVGLLLHFREGPWMDEVVVPRGNDAVAAPYVPVWSGVVLCIIMIAASVLMAIWFRRILGILLGRGGKHDDDDYRPQSEESSSTQEDDIGEDHILVP